MEQFLPKNPSPYLEGWPSLERAPVWEEPAFRRVVLANRPAPRGWRLPDPAIEGMFDRTECFSRLTSNQKLLTFSNQRQHGEAIFRKTEGNRISRNFHLRLPKG